MNLGSEAESDMITTRVETMGRERWMEESEHDEGEKTRRESKENWESYGGNEDEDEEKA